MKAVVHERFGLDELEFVDVDVPTVGPDQVLVRVRASSVNPVEFYNASGPPFLRLLNREFRRPRGRVVGADLAGTVEAVGTGVTDLAPGDDVVGLGSGTWSEFAVASRARLARKPVAISFGDAAALPIAALTALQALRKGEVRAGHAVLVNGGSGGVGTFAIQIAKAMGAVVTAVCSPGNVQQARDLGADHVVDYTTEDFTRSSERYDVLLDIAGSRSYLRYRKVLTANAVVILVGAKMSSSPLGPLKHIGATKLLSIGRSQPVRFFITDVTTADLEHVMGLMESGAVRSVIDRRFALAEAPDALRYFAQGHARGKVIIDVQS